MKKRFLVIIICIALISVAVAGVYYYRQPEVVDDSPPPPLVKLDVSAYPLFSDTLLYDNLADAVVKTIEYLEKRPQDRTYEYGEDTYTAAHLLASCRAFLDFIRSRPTEPMLNDHIRRYYHVYQCTGSEGSGNMLVTGYYEPKLYGSLQPTEKFKYPLYTRPTDMITADLAAFYPELKGKRITGRLRGNTIIPYFDRKAIENKENYHETAPPLVWVDSRIDLFFLQIQGSGLVALASGEEIHVHYHTANGHPYRSIGRLLIDKGKIPKAEMSMQRIRQYLEENPDEIDAILNYNPSYVFFKQEADGPIGYMGKKLTPIRSIALDRRIFPLAALAYIDTKIPEIRDEQAIDTWLDLKAFVVNQDTGGAIRGTGRVDLFWGNGKAAEMAAGHMQHDAMLYFLVLKPAA
ncbi:MAG: murein transglycosylase [Desulfobacteraceae bacterium]|nr:murein transglycosylase [Desulfobacteraceae bacterium]